MMIQFHLDSASGVAPYLQIVQQVRHALRLGLLREGDQLPTVREVVSTVTINPNTVHKAYRELEYAGLVTPRPGLGTFVTGSLTGDVPAASYVRLRADLVRWIEDAQRAGLDDESVEALVHGTLREHLRVEP
jgi:GntR family transcriptional regulator